MFSPSVCSFFADRDYENHNSGIFAWVTSFTGENALGFIQLNEFVFGANTRIDILHRVVVWQRAKRRAVSELHLVIVLVIKKKTNIIAFNIKMTTYMSKSTTLKH